MFICAMVIWCAVTLKTRLESGPVTADLTTTVHVVHRYKLLKNGVKSIHLLNTGGKTLQRNTFKISIKLPVILLFYLFIFVKKI